MRPLRALAQAGVAAGAYALAEARWYRLHTLEVPVVTRGPDLTVLHVSDTHLGDRHGRLVRFLHGLPDRVGIPDLVVATGDLIQDDGGIDPIVDALARLEARLGQFYVLGSHDYYRSRFQGYTKYFGPRRTEGRTLGVADTERLESGLQAKGWAALTNRSEIVADAHGTIRIAGVDDPYLRRHRTDHIHRAADERLAIGLVHAPDVVSEWLLNGFDLVLGGHTHAGQVRLPGIGAIATNCALPAALAGGLNRIGNGYLHVSPGLGTGRFAPVRFNCRPEATLLHLTARL